jgi:hypothetical protein
MKTYKELVNKGYSAQSIFNLINESEREKLIEEANERAKASPSGIAFKPGIGNLTRPAKHNDVPDVASAWADYCNYKWPINDATHCKSAIGYFNQDGMQDAGKYTDSEWAALGKAIAIAATKYLGVDYIYEGKKIIRKE